MGRVGGGAGHDDLDGALVVIVVVPLRAQAHELAVQLDADAPAHAHHHRLALEGFEALLEVVDDVPGDELDRASSLRRRPPAAPTWS